MSWFSKKKKEVAEVSDLSGLETGFGDDVIMQETEKTVMYMLGEKDKADGMPALFTEDADYMNGYNGK